ncbi:SH3 domain-containing protein [Streptomyces sp. NPDC004629]|uniref:SH3 domain-containing protein n=1 Tax=Streptomyces sp. NPDC004629 TaxID=3364705 RepID=UPI0036771FEF
MIRRTVKSGLLATVAALALLPTAASAADAGWTAPLPAPAAAAQSALSSVPPAPARHAPVRHGAEHRHHWHHSHHGHHGQAHHRHHATHRVHGIALRTAYRQGPSTTGRVATHHVRLNVRSGPGTGHRVVGHRHDDRLVTITCKTHGSWVSGNRTWYRLAHHKGYVSARYVRVGTAVPWC